MTDQVGYSVNADFWIRIMGERLDRLRNELTDPAVFAALGDVAGLDVLDVGCGEGYLSRDLSQRGATVTGIDLNADLIGAARQREADEGRGITFEVGDLTALRFLNDSFDAVVANHVLNDIEDLDTAVGEVARVLRPDGRFVMLILHPCFYYQRSGLDEEDREWVGLYFTNRPRLQSFNVAGIPSPGEVQAWHRPLEAYFASFARHGLIVTSLAEPHPDEELRRSDAWWREKWKRPMFLCATIQRKVGVASE